MEGSGFTVFEPTMLHVPTSLTNDDAVMRAHSFNPSELETESGPITVYRLSNASRCKMQSREGNYDLDYKGMRYVSFIYVCWQRFNYCKVLNLEKSNAASSKQVSAHFVVEGAFEGAEDPRVFFFDGESYVLFNAPTKVKIKDKSDITTRAMFISRLVGMEARATSIVLTESSFQMPAKNFIPLVTERTVFLVTALEPFEICELSFHVATFGVCKRKFVAVNESRTTYTNQLHGGSNSVTTTSGYLAVVHYAVHGIFGRLYVHKFVLFSKLFPHKPVWFSEAFLVRSDVEDGNTDITFVSGLRQGETSDEFILLYGVADCLSYRVKVNLDLQKRFVDRIHILPRQQPRLLPTVQWEGPLNDLSSFAVVARELFADAHFKSDEDFFRWRFVNTDGINLISSNTSYSQAYRLHDAIAKKNLDLWPMPALTVRMTWPIMLHKPASGRVAHYFPWEFNVLPREISKSYLDDVWVTSKNVKDTMLSSGIENDNIFMLPHGVSQEYCDAFKYRNRKSKGTFVFLFHNGGLFRKGYDILIPSFVSAFSPIDDVKLIVHSSYASTAAKEIFHRELKLVSTEYRRKIEVIEQFLEQEAILDMLQRVDVLLQPSRAEGFGLGVLQGMAIGLPAIVPRYGGFLDFVTDETSYIFDVALENCHLPPCDKYGSTMWEGLFHAPTGRRFKWARIRKAQLAKAMRRAYEDRHEGLVERSIAGHNLACSRDYSWDQAYLKMRKRIFHLIASK